MARSMMWGLSTLAMAGGALVLQSLPTIPQSVAATTVIAQPTEGSVDNPEAVRDFLTKLQLAAARGDRRTLVSLVRFPFTTYDRGRPKITYHRPQDLLNHFGQVFTPKVMAAIRQARYETLFINYQGMMIGHGEVWFDERSDGIMIKAINSD